MDELFDTTKLFTLSGNQKYTSREFKPPELKSRLILKELSRPTTDELYERKPKKGEDNYDATYSPEDNKLGLYSVTPPAK